jgi:hypothetical protein
LTFTTTGVQAPTVGATHGFSVIVSSGDLMGSNDPLNQPGVLGGTGTIIGTPPPTVLIHDGTVFAAGLYYFTPVVYGNATGTGNITALTLDTGCTYTGASVLVNLLPQGDPYCATGIEESGAHHLQTAYFDAEGALRVDLVADRAEDAEIGLYDLAGRKVYTFDASLVPSQNSLRFSVMGLKAGVYLLRVKASFEATQKVTRF